MGFVQRPYCLYGAAGASAPVFGPLGCSSGTWLPAGGVGAVGSGTPPSGFGFATIVDPSHVRTFESPVEGFLQLLLSIALQFALFGGCVVGITLTSVKAQVQLQYSCIVVILGAAWAIAELEIQAMKPKPITRPIFLRGTDEIEA
jgi:hypothetical protein